MRRRKGGGRTPTPRPVELSPPRKTASRQRASRGREFRATAHLRPKVRCAMPPGACLRAPAQKLILRPGEFGGCVRTLGPLQATREAHFNAPGAPGCVLSAHGALARGDPPRILLLIGEAGAGATHPRPNIITYLAIRVGSERNAPPGFSGRFKLLRDVARLGLRAYSAFNYTHHLRSGLKRAQC